MSLIARNFQRLALRRGNIRNALYPNAATWNLIIRAQGHAMAYSHREVYRRAYELGAFVGTAGTNVIGRFRFRTGPGVTTLTYVVMMGLDTTAGFGPPLATNPYLEIDTTISGGATTSRQFHHGQSSTAGTDAPSEISLVTSDVAVTPGTVYEVAIKTVGYARPVSVVAFEQADLTVTESTSHYNLHQPAASSPIYDANRQRMALGLSEMWRTMGGIVWNFHMEDGSARTRTSLVPINILDNATTGTPATSDYGFYLNPSSHQTLSATTVPFELAAYGNVSGGGDGVVRLQDSAGNVYGNVAISSGTDAWHTATINLPATDTFYAAQFNSDGANVTTVSAISLIEWTAP